MNSTSNIVLLIHTYFLTLSQLPFLLPPAPPLFSFFFFLFSSFFFLLSSIFLYQPLTYNNTIHFHCPFFHFFATYLSPPPQSISLSFIFLLLSLSHLILSPLHLTLSFLSFYPIQFSLVLSLPGVHTVRKFGCNLKVRMHKLITY